MVSKWIYRDGEIQLAQFVKLTSTAKQEHIRFLLTIEKKLLSTNDQYILNQYGPKQIIKKFLNLTDEKEENS
jgi:hypothetical protein